MTITSMLQSYASSGFGGSLGLGTRQAVIMVDFAKAYFEEGSPLYANAEGVRTTAIAMLRRARMRGMPVIHTRVEYDAAGVNGGIFYQKIAALSVFRAGGPLAGFAQGLEPTAGEPIVTKQYASAFFGTTLASLLTTLGVDCVLIAGMSTSGCVRATAVDAIQSGFIPVVLEDCVGDRHDAPHRASLFDLAAKYADVQKSDDVFARL
ncbi:N-carbamoylsarcosine amidase [Cupriavidus necator H850]|uniref:isochorismatase family protein n=1 Tax=Cupriavidus necator TaxID=106590 RepID=UPI00129DBD7C|nr:isochorismatase family protein [Cupriavidus necator]KAI3596435.1 N-carbamoylsarcosine amidase [Cupriavidus necator H850]